MNKVCIFCNIINNSKKKINFLYEDDDVVVLRDINPQAPVHLLIIPRNHIRSVNNLSKNDTNILIKIIMVAKQMAKQENIDQSGYKIFFNVEKGGGQVIFHLHLHLIGGWTH